MIANLIANGLNVALDPLCIFGFWFIPRLEMTGAAIATVISTGVAAGFLVLCNAKMLKRTPWRPHWALIRQSCRFGIPIGIQRFLGCLGFLGFVIILGRCGEAHLAAHVLVIRVMSISFLPGHAISEAASVLVGQSVGARRADRAFEAWRAATLLAIAIMVSCGAVFVAFPGPFIQLFGAADQVAEIARSLMVIAAVVQIFDAIAMVGLGSINGSGDTRYSMFVSVMCAWLVQLPLALWLAIALNWGATGAWLGLTAEIILLAALALHRVLSGRWLRRTGLVHVRRPTPAFV